MPHSLRLILGILLILLGVVTYILPIPLGIFLIVLGSLLLSRDVPFFARLMEAVKNRFPGIGRAAERWRNRIFGES